MRALLISGSRNPGGRTGESVRAIERGLSANGASAEVVFLPDLTIERCRQCEDNGWGLCEREGTCSIDDDFSAIVDKIASSDVVTFATPVYFSDLSESMRALLDRLRRTCITELGRQRTSGLSAIGLCMAGGSGGGAVACCLRMEQTLLGCGFDVVDMIPIRRQNLQAKIPVLELVGRWLATKPRSL